MGDGGEDKKDKGTVIFRPGPPKGAEAKGMRLAGCVVFVLSAAMVYAGAVVWFAYRGRSEADARVRGIQSLALTSFGARTEGGAVEGVLPPDAGRAGADMRSILEERLKRLKGKSFSCSAGTASSWEPLKPDPRGGFTAVPPGTRVLDLHDLATCHALRAMHGVDNFLRVLATFSLDNRGRHAVVVRLEVAVFAKDASAIWTDIFTETQDIPIVPAGDPRHSDASMFAFRTAMFRAADRLAAAFDPEEKGK